MLIEHNNHIISNWYALMGTEYGTFVTGMVGYPYLGMQVEIPGRAGTSDPR